MRYDLIPSNRLKLFFIVFVISSIALKTDSAVLSQSKFKLSNTDVNLEKEQWT